MTNEEAKTALLDLLTTDHYELNKHYDAVVKAVEAFNKLMEIEELIQACEGCETAYGMREYPCAEAYHDIVKVMRGAPIF